MTSHHKTNRIVCGESTCVQPCVHTALHEQMEPGVYLKAKVRPELPDEICEPSSSALKKNNQTQREEFLSWQSAIITEVLLSSPSRPPLFSPSFTFPLLRLSFPTVSEDCSQACWGPSLSSMWAQEWGNLSAAEPQSLGGFLFCAPSES